jgi:hypothetical protein
VGGRGAEGEAAARDEQQAVAFGPRAHAAGAGDEAVHPFITSHVFSAAGAGKEEFLVKPGVLTVDPDSVPADCTTPNSFSSSVLKLNPPACAARE